MLWHSQVMCQTPNESFLVTLCGRIEKGADKGYGQQHIPQKADGLIVTSEVKHGQRSTTKTRCNGSFSDPF